MVESGLRHFSTFSQIDYPFKNEIAVKEFNGIWNVKKSLIDAEVACEVCSHIGCFDVWDLEEEGDKVYKEPNSNQPWEKFYIDKMPDGLVANATPIQTGSNSIALTYFELLLQVLKSMPDRVFIEQTKGFFEASIFYNFEYDTAMFNSFRHMGLSKSEIELSIKTLRQEFKKEAGINW